MVLWAKEVNTVSIKPNESILVVSRELKNKLKMEAMLDGVTLQSLVTEILTKHADDNENYVQHYSKKAKEAKAKKK